MYLHKIVSNQHRSWVVITTSFILYAWGKEVSEQKKGSMYTLNYLLVGP